MPSMRPFYAETEMIKPDQRKAIRDAIRLWHPDKFAQMFSQRIPSNESDRVMEIVHVVTQALLNYGK